MESYYRLIKPVKEEDHDYVYDKSEKRNLNPVLFETKEGTSVIALQLTPTNLHQFDNSIKDLNVKYFVFTNIKFKKIIELAQYSKIKIRSIKAEGLGIYNSEEISDTIGEYLSQKDYPSLLKYIKDNELVIKEMEIILPTNKIIRIYESGVFWVDSELSESSPLKSIFNSIFDLV